MEQSYEEAMKWYLKAADKGHVGIRYHIADLYDQGLGIEKSPEKAREWRTSAGKDLESLKNTC